MRKLKYILASVVLSAGFASCETETIDEKVKDNTIVAKPILRFDFNDQQTVVTDEVRIDWTNDNMFTLTAKFSALDAADPSEETRYKPATLSISFNSLIAANFPTRLTLNNPNLYISTASLTILNGATYRTSNAKETEDAGFANIREINDTGKYIDGDFEYILYPSAGSNLQPQRLRNGKFNYVKY